MQLNQTKMNVSVGKLELPLKQNRDSAERSEQASERASEWKELERTTE